MSAFVNRYLNQIISFTVMFLMLVAIVHGQVLVRSSMVADVPASTFETAAAERGLDR